METIANILNKTKQSKNKLKVESTQNPNSG